MSERLRVALVFGGRSVEHEVSVVSARGVNAALDRGRYEVLALAVTGDGVWLPPSRSETILRSSDVRVDAGGERARVVGAPGEGLLVISAAGEAKPVEVDVVLSVLHGWGGEDGRLQGLLDWAGIPYVGAGVLGSAAGMDKAVAKRLAQEAGVPVGPWRLVTQAEFSRDPGGTSAGLESALGEFVFVKPANGGSSVGITKVREASGLHAALQEAFRFDPRVLVERALDAREIECAVLGNDLPEASVPGEIVPSSEYYDYRAKYVDGSSGLLIPAPVPPDVAAGVRAHAVRVFRALDLAGMARVDFFLERGTDRLLFNEVNTLPGFTPISMYPKLWAATGVPYPALLDRLVALAVERHRAERGREVRHAG